MTNFPNAADLAVTLGLVLAGLSDGIADQLLKLIERLC